MKDQKSKIKNQRYKTRIKYFLFLIPISAFCFLLFAFPSHAQLSSLGIANYLEIPTGNIEDGSIIVLSSKNYILSKAPYDPNIIGVVNLTPAVSIKSDTTRKGYPVVSIGTVATKVNGTNGEIRKGDNITTSSVQGTGMKATDSGFVLGEALEGAKFGKATDTKLIDVAANPHYVQLNSQLGSSLSDLFKLSKIAAYEKPTKALQYILAAVIIIASFGSGFLIFSKVITKGMEALGRNPLAGRMIQLGIVFNVILIAVIIISGTALAYLVIRL
jgi:hypothetical protein